VGKIASGSSLPAPDRVEVLNLPEVRVEYDIPLTTAQVEELTITLRGLEVAPTLERILPAHEEEEYDSKKRLARRTKFRTANQDGTFSNKIEETVFSYLGQTSILLSCTTTKFDRLGNALNSDIQEYTTEQLSGGRTILRLKGNDQ